METVKEVLLSIGYSPKDAGKGWHCRPLYRDSDSNTVLCVDKESGLWYDFAKDIGGTLQNLVARTLDKSEDEVKTFFEENSIEISNTTEEEESIDYEQKTFPIEWLTRLKNEHLYWKARGVSETTVKKFMGGVAVNGRMINRYVFPIFDENKKIQGFNGRDLVKGSKRVKWKLMGRKKGFCYPTFLNNDILKKQKEVILVESIGDMLSLWDNGIKNVIVIFGLYVFPSVLKKLLEISPNRIVIAVNDDSRNKGAGNVAAVKIARQLNTYFDSSTIVTHLPPEDKGDFGEMSSEDISLWKTQLKNYQPQG
jgi:DNA primase